MFEPDGKPDKIRCHACRQLLLLGQLLMRGCSRMNRQRLGIADICQVRNQLQRIDKLFPRFRACLLYTSPSPRDS